jgi:ribonucleotide reductase alpha subunit
MENGDVNDGTPLLANRTQCDRWQRIMKVEYGRLARDCQCGRSTLLDCYGATDIGEFFAVATEWALEIPPEQHVQVQAAFQRHVDNAVSKTVNLPSEATPSDVAGVYRLAHQLGCKGITVYRYGSKAERVLQLGIGERLEEREYFTKCDPGACRL